jgi:hypothetical protein
MLPVMYKRVRFSLLIVVSLFAIGANGAPTAYSVNSDSGTTNQDHLYTIDLSTGLETRIGPLVTGIPGDVRRDTEGLAIAPDGVLWGVDDESRTLFPINKGNGFIKLLAEVPLTSFPPQQQVFGGHDFGLTFSCDNTLYVVSVQTQTLHNLQLDGSSTVIGSTGALGVNISAIAAIGNPTQLYGLGNGTLKNGDTDSPNLYSIDVVSGTASWIGSLGDAVSDYDQAGLGFDDIGNLWAITDRRIINENNAANKPSEILQIDVNTGTAKVVWTTSEIGFESLAIAPPSDCNDDIGGGGSSDSDTTSQFDTIPTLNPAGRLLAICILMLTGMTVLRKRLS